MSSPAPGSATGIDNAGSLLLWTIATQMQADFFKTNDVLIVPEPTWASADFNNQCLGDPGTDRGGTLGAVNINSWTATSGGDNWLLVTNGWTHTAYVATLFGCAGPGSPTLTATLNATGQSYRNQVSFLPIFLYWTYRAAAAGGTSAVGTGVLAGIVAAGTNSQLASINLGSIAAVMTVPRAYIDSAANLDMETIQWCTNKSVTSSAIRTHICGGVKASSTPAPWRNWGKCANPNEAALNRLIC